MIQFPETAQRQWQAIADVANAGQRLKEKIEHDTLVSVEVERMRRRHEATQIFRQELDADSTPALEMMTLANYTSNPSLVPVDMIDGVVKVNGTTLVLGPSGSGKSTLGLQMLYSMLTGEDWLEQTTKPLMGSVGILSYDMDANLMLDWMSGYPSVDQNKVNVVNAHKRGNPLGVPALRNQIAAAWKHAGVEVVMIDSFSATFFGKDQNDAAATMDQYRNIIKFALTECEAKALIVIVHSTESNPNKARGSTVHHDVADSIVVVDGVGLDPRKVHMAKYRAALGQHQMKPCILTAPDDVTHLVELDTGAMAMAGMHLPPSAAAQAFTVVPDAHEDPDIDSDDGEEDDDL